VVGMIIEVSFSRDDEKVLEVGLVVPIFAGHDARD
jgi:hypothetical protein